ncbi:MAG: hypothetical protein HC923_08465, partial [Myxococcales bacterium]|nr:hypothetical protein [Myxococcales bacterium]
MGSTTENFLLGFEPIQVNRKQQGTSGALEEATDDELSQLQRLIDYGLVTGIDEVSQVLPLEATQGDREPRNEEELIAQGYLLGNCSGCHNPRGFPSVQFPELRDVLNFYPTKEGGGVFQFPLERYSPRIFRGPLGQPVPIAYITPALKDRTTDDPAWVSKRTVLDQSSAQQCSSGDTSREVYLPAPWRSLIYRNVATPYTYADDNAIYPRMPFHMPGHDCRAPQILGEWMVSIPARLKNPNSYERACFGPPGNQRIEPDTLSQPFQEVLQTDPDFFVEWTRAQSRLNTYRNDLHYADFDQDGRPDFCPDTRDIVDWDIMNGQRASPPDETALPGGAAGIPVPQDSGVFAFIPDGVPDRGHYPLLDLTEPVGEWNPRRGDWQDVIRLENGTSPKFDALPPSEQAVVTM